MSLDKSINLNTYTNVEILENYSSPIDLEVHRKERILSKKKQLEFFQRKTFGKRISAIEIGSGSSALLYSLSKANILMEGVGIELAKKRWEFAEKWKADENLTQVKNKLQN